MTKPSGWHYIATTRAKFSPCPKCGHAGLFRGPRYGSARYDDEGGFREWLEFWCEQCRYVQTVPCLDASE